MTEVVPIQGTVLMDEIYQIVIGAWSEEADRVVADRLGLPLSYLLTEKKQSWSGELMN